MNVQNQRVVSQKSVTLQLYKRISDAA